MPTHQYLVSTDKLATGKSTSFSLGNHLSAFVEAQVGQGHYGSVSDVVRAGLRLLEDEETELAALRAALIEGEQNGPCIPFYFETFVAGKRARLSKPG